MSSSLLSKPTEVRIMDSDGSMGKLSFSLSPMQALIAAYEQQLGNNNTWTYRDPSKYPIRAGKYGFSLGNCWVKHD